MISKCSVLCWIRTQFSLQGLTQTEDTTGEGHSFVRLNSCISDQYRTIATNSHDSLLLRSDSGAHKMYLLATGTCNWNRWEEIWKAKSKRKRRRKKRDVSLKLI